MCFQLKAARSEKKAQARQQAQESALDSLQEFYEIQDSLFSLIWVFIPVVEEKVLANFSYGAGFRRGKIWRTMSAMADKVRRRTFGGKMILQQIRVQIPMA